MLRNGVIPLALLLLFAACSQLPDGDLTVHAESQPEVAALTEPGLDDWDPEPPPTTTTTTTPPPPPPPTTTTTHPPSPPAQFTASSAGSSGTVNGYPCGGDLPTCHVLACESGGNPTAENPHSTASGLWQILDSTWAGFGGYAHAAAAPWQVQNDKARLLWAGGAGRSHWAACL